MGGHLNYQLPSAAFVSWLTTAPEVQQCLRPLKMNENEDMTAQGFIVDGESTARASGRVQIEPGHGQGGGSERGRKGKGGTEDLGPREHAAENRS